MVLHKQGKNLQNGIIFANVLSSVLIKYADIKRQANNGISIVQNFLLKQRNLANLNY